MVDDTKQTAPLRRWVRVVLVASLALNLLIAGVVAGVVLKGPSQKQNPRPSRGDVALPYTRALSEEHRQISRRELRRVVFAGRDEQGALGQHYSGALVVLRADPFDLEALSEVFDVQTRSAQQRLAQGQQVLLSVIANMSEQDRKAFADRLEAELSALEARGKAWAPHRKPGPDRKPNPDR